MSEMVLSHSLEVDRAGVWIQDAFLCWSSGWCVLVMRGELQWTWWLPTLTTAAPRGLTFNVLVDNALQPVQPLHNAQGLPFAVLLQLSLRLATVATLRYFGTPVGHIVGDPADIQEAHDVGHPAQDHTCWHQSFSSPCAQHRDISPWASCSPTPAGRWSAEETHSRNSGAECGLSPPLLSQSRLRLPWTLWKLRFVHIPDAITLHKRVPAEHPESQAALRRCKAVRLGASPPHQPASQPGVHTRPNRRGEGGPKPLTPAHSHRGGWRGGGVEETPRELKCGDPGSDGYAGGLIKVKKVRLC